MLQRFKIVVLALLLLSASFYFSSCGLTHATLDEMIEEGLYIDSPHTFKPESWEEENETHYSARYFSSVKLSMDKKNFSVECVKADNAQEDYSGTYSGTWEKKYPEGYKLKCENFEGWAYYSKYSDCYKLQIDKICNQECDFGTELYYAPVK